MMQCVNALRLRVYLIPNTRQSVSGHTERAVEQGVEDGT
jgi:hypothetical protein